MVLLVGCQSGNPGKTTVNFNLAGSDTVKSKISTKVGDLHAFVVAKNSSGNIVAVVPIPADSTTLSFEVPNNFAVTFKVIAYIETVVPDQQESEVPPGSLVTGGAIYEGSSQPVDLFGNTVTVSVDVALRTDLIALHQQVLARNNTDVNDFFNLPGVEIKLVDLETNFEYPPMFPSQGGMLVHPAVIPNHPYRLVANFGNGTIEQVVIPTTSATVPIYTAPTMYFQFTPVQVTTEIELHQAIDNANINAGLEVVDVIAGTSGLILNLANPLPALQDPFGIVLRGIGSVEINGANFSASSQPGLRILSSRNIVHRLNFKDFSDFGIVVDNSLSSSLQINVISACRFNNNLGGIDVKDATFTFVGPANTFVDNNAFGVRVRGASAFTKIFGNSIVHHAIGVDIIENAQQVSVDNNFIGINLSGITTDANRLGILVDTTGSEISIRGNRLTCNSDASVQSGCTASTAVPLPSFLTPGEGIAVTAISPKVEISKNIVDRNSRGVSFLDNATQSHHLEHNTISSNDVGVYFGQSVTGVEITETIISKSTTKGIVFNAISTAALFRNNLLFNFNGSIDNDCLAISAPTYCSSAIETAVNIDCDYLTQSSCDPLFVDDLTFPNDFSLLPASPAIDKGDTQSGGTPQPFLGAAPDLGAIESH
jgi:hypothetical protein